MHKLACHDAFSEIGDQECLILFDKPVVGRPTDCEVATGNIEVLVAFGILLRSCLFFSLRPASGGFLGNEEIANRQVARFGANTWKREECVFCPTFSNLQANAIIICAFFALCDIVPNILIRLDRESFAINLFGTKSRVIIRPCTASGP